MGILSGLFFGAIFGYGLLGDWSELPDHEVLGEKDDPCGFYFGAERGEGGVKRGTLKVSEVGGWRAETGKVVVGPALSHYAVTRHPVAMTPDLMKAPRNVSLRVYFYATDARI